MSHTRVHVTVVICCLSLACGKVAFKSADQASAHKTESKAVGEIQVPAGFRAVRVVAGLNYPSAMTWDSFGRMYILESHTVPLPGLKPKIRRVEPDGDIEDIELRGDNAPGGGQAIGLAFHEGLLYFTHEEADGSWGIFRVPLDGGTVEPVVSGLPGRGDHAVNYLAFDREGNLYFGLGSATNAGVVSSHDGVNNKWLAKRPDAHDIPCKELVLTGQKFIEPNALTKDDEKDLATTGAYQRYGEAGATRVNGERLCTSAVYRLAPGGRPEVMAWGFRNPVGLAFDLDGALFVAMQGADIRSTRPVLDDPDAIYRVHEGAWYGWPDFSAALEPITDQRYRAPQKYLADGHDSLQFVIDHAASGLTAPTRSWLVTPTAPHAAVCGMTVVPREGAFAKWGGRLLVAEMGDFRPATDPANPNIRAGFQIEAINLSDGRRETFARNRGTGEAQPASALDLSDAFERPVDVKVGPDGMIYVLDFGVFTPTDKAAKVFPKTGKVFRIEPI